MIARLKLKRLGCPLFESEESGISKDDLPPPVGGSRPGIASLLWIKSGVIVFTERDIMRYIFLHNI